MFKTFRKRKHTNSYVRQGEAFWLQPMLRGTLNYKIDAIIDSYLNHIMDGKPIPRGIASRCCHPLQNISRIWNLPLKMHCIALAQKIRRYSYTEHKENCLRTCIPKQFFCRSAPSDRSLKASQGFLAKSVSPEPALPSEWSSPPRKGRRLIKIRSPGILLTVERDSGVFLCVILLC